MTTKPRDPSRRENEDEHRESRDNRGNPPARLWNISCHFSATPRASSFGWDTFFASVSRYHPSTLLGSLSFRGSQRGVSSLRFQAAGIVSFEYHSYQLSQCLWEA